MMDSSTVVMNTNNAAVKPLLPKLDRTPYSSATTSPRLLVRPSAPGSSPAPPSPPATKPAVMDVSSKTIQSPSILSWVQEQPAEHFNPYTSRQKRRRTNKEELAVLEAAYRQNTHPSADMRNRLGELLGLSTRKVQVWFQNKRQHEKKRLQKAAAATKAQETSSATIYASGAPGTPGPSVDQKLISDYHSMTTAVSSASSSPRSESAHIQPLAVNTSSVRRPKSEQLSSLGGFWLPSPRIDPRCAVRPGSVPCYSHMRSGSVPPCSFDSINSQLVRTEPDNSSVASLPMTPVDNPNGIGGHNRSFSMPMPLARPYSSVAPTLPPLRLVVQNALDNWEHCAHPPSSAHAPQSPLSHESALHDFAKD